MRVNQLDCWTIWTIDFALISEPLPKQFMLVEICILCSCLPVEVASLLVGTKEARSVHPCCSLTLDDLGVGMENHNLIKIGPASPL